METSRMRHLFISALTLALGLSASACFAQPFLQADADSTVRQSEQVLAEIMAMPGKAIPEYLLSEAQGVVIVPNVIKIGFIAGVRRGHGVVLVRDAEGEWSLPQFVTLTGGSVGWQAGIQGTDVVLVFTTRKGVQGLMQGKFTIGADASVSAGPVGRNAAASTDATLKSEILSYSRSRGLFLGVAIDGSVLEIDGLAHAAYYGSPTAELPRQVPDSAIKLRQFLVDSCAVGALATGGAPVAVVAPGGPAGAVPTPPAAGPPPVLPASRLEAERRALIRSAQQLQVILKPEWQAYLALPKEIYDGGAVQPELMNDTIARYDRILRGHEYQQLAQRPEFQTTYDLLRQYSRETSAMVPPPLNLPPPPAAVGAAPGAAAPR
jgi:lipid-binding SYLF domain-containing protein